MSKRQTLPLSRKEECLEQRTSDSSTLRPATPPARKSKYRTIVRFALNGESGVASKEQSAIQDRLRKLGFYLIGTGTWNCDNLSPANFPVLAEVLGDVIGVSERTEGSVALDHVWSYVDVS